MAQALLAHRLTAMGYSVAVRSGGMLGDGELPSPEAIAAMAGFGLDISAHRSHRVTADDLASADLTLAMARANLRHAVVEAPAVWPLAFTIKELVRRGERIGPRAPGESLAGWLARAHDGRERAALLGDSPDDDVADPTGGPRRAYAETAAILSGLAGQLVRLCWPAAGG
jgi:protein-tyrosine-phosphatase